ncbi:MAG TPA: alpha/beta fold hydrolase [Segetibacter sp.]
MKKITSFLLIITLIAGCRKDTGIDVPEGSELFVSATTVGSFNKETIKAFAQASGYGSYTTLLKYDVDFLKIVYKTTYKGSTIEVSGLLCIPKNMPVAPSLLSAQHGTTLTQADAPSNFPSTFTGFELFASTGFVTVIPDFIGYGVSKNIKHPYYDQQLSGTTVVDMLKAVKYYLKRESIATSNRLFLIGYSEGGYVTMAAQKEIETHAEHNLNITAAAEGAGGYDLQSMFNTIVNTSNYTEPGYLAFILQSYNTTYSWNRPYSDFFQEPYASRIPSLLDGIKSLAQINAGLTTSMTALLNPTFYANLKSTTGEPVLKQALANNSFSNWVPKSRTRLYHGTADVTVFYNTTETTYNRFRAAGATNVELITIPNGNHQTSIDPMLSNAFEWFLSLDK